MKSLLRVSFLFLMSFILMQTSVAASDWHIKAKIVNNSKQDLILVSAKINSSATKWRPGMSTNDKKVIHPGETFKVSTSRHHGHSMPF